MYVLRLTSSDRFLSFFLFFFNLMAAIIVLILLTSSSTGDACRRHQGCIGSVIITWCSLYQRLSLLLMEIKWCNEVNKSGRQNCWKSGPFSLQQLWMQNFYWQILLTVTWYWFWLNCDWIHDDGSIEFDILFASYRKLLQSATIRWQMLLPFFRVRYVRHFPRRKIFDFAWAYKIGTSLHRGDNV